MSTVTLTTDFGTRDAYVGSMKGVILSLAPEATIVDLSHEVAPQDIAEGAFVLWGGYRWFPEGTMHVAVVDPGVGTGRRGLVIETARYTFVGPDNGLLSPVFSREDVKRAVAIENSDLMLEPVSATFHGRDVFAPAAGHLLQGIPIDAFGAEVSDPILLDLWECPDGEGFLAGRIVHVDRFGNCVTNLDRGSVEAHDAGGRVAIEVSDAVLDGVVRTYAEVSAGTPVALFGSFDTLEIAVNKGSAAEALGLNRGDEVRIRQA